MRPRLGTAITTSLGTFKGQTGNMAGSMYLLVEETHGEWEVSSRRPWHALPMMEGNVKVF